MIRIFHDFNKLEVGVTESFTSAPLICLGTKNDIDSLQITLAEGMCVTLYQQDDVKSDGSPDFLEVDAKIRFDQVRKIFLADFNYDELGYQSKKAGG